MDFLSALRLSRWVRRTKWTSWIVINNDLTNLKTKYGPVSREDLLADDWEAHDMAEPEDNNQDSAVVRFSLLELD